MSSLNKKGRHATCVIAFEHYPHRALDYRSLKESSACEGIIQWELVFGFAGHKAREGAFQVDNRLVRMRGCHSG
ncbi:hypothetical protein [Pseudomonas sp. VD9]|uniref:hypothetical protein n=1 Tax=Pseudomonas sp. VD9 TaxID=3342076 RepID=UPI003C6BF683